MLDFWLDLPIALLVLGTVAAFATSATLLNWLSFHSPAAEWIRGLRGIVAPFFTAITLLFGLFLAFLASDVWERKREASRVVLAERDALTFLMSLAMTNDREAREIGKAAKGYVSTVIKEEWQEMRRQRSSPKASDALHHLIMSVTSRAIHYPSGIHNEMLRKTLTIREARASRLSLSHDRAEGLKWLSVILLAVISQISIAAVQLDRSAPQRAALTIFTLAATLTICVVAAYERPFDGPISVPADPLTEFLATIPQPG